MAMMLASWELSQTLMLAAGVVVIAIVIMRSNRRRAGRDRPVSQADRSDRTAQNVRDQLDQLMVQLEELARMTAGQIETRYSKLDTLLAEADEKITRLQSLLAGQKTGQATCDTAGVDAVNPEHQKVYGLADEGHSPIQIARQIGRPIGEVELILALRKNR